MRFYIFSIPGDDSFFYSLKPPSNIIESISSNVHVYTDGVLSFSRRVDRLLYRAIASITRSDFCPQYVRGTVSVAISTSKLPENWEEERNASQLYSSLDRAATQEIEGRCLAEGEGMAGWPLSLETSLLQSIVVVRQLFHPAPLKRERERDIERSWRQNPNEPYQQSARARANQR